jgi:hypothetical protein
MAESFIKYPFGHPHGFLHNCEVDHFVAFLFIFPVLPYPVRPAKTDTPELVARFLEDNVTCPKITRLRRDIISKMVAPGTDSYIPARLKDGIPIIPIIQPSSGCSVIILADCNKPDTLRVPPLTQLEALCAPPSGTWQAWI